MNVLGRRRTERILAPVRIRVIGNDISGVAFTEETVTVSFNQQGARISLVHTLLPDDIVLVKNLENDVEEDFRVIGAFQKVFGSRREWGVEAVKQDCGIWGMQFAPDDDRALPKVLVECAVCNVAAHSALSSIEYDVLLAVGLISRHCDRCGETTRWKPSALAVTEVFWAPSDKAPPQSTKQRRAARLNLIMQLPVRNASGVVDIAHTRDVSKAGLCIVSAQRLSAGDEIQITLPYKKSQAPVETKGKVIWVAESAAGRFCGVEYLP